MYTSVKTEEEVFQQRTGGFQGNNYAASRRVESKGYPLMMIEFFLLLPPEFYRDVQMKSFPSILLHHCPTRARGR